MFDETNEQPESEKTVEPILKVSDEKDTEPKKDTEKKRGRPKGAPNKEKKPETLPRRRRKAPGDVGETKAYIEGLTDDMNKTIAIHNRRNGTAFNPIVNPLKSGEGPLRDWSGDTVEVVLGSVFELVGYLFDLETRPDPKALKKCADSWVNLGEHLPPVSPLKEAIAGVIISTAITAVPMVIEVKEKRKLRLKDA